MKKEIPILMYHSLDPDRFQNKMALPLEIFFRQMNFLKKNHYEVISLPAYVQEGMKQDLFGRKAVITFDDGYLDNFTQALPILRGYGFPATFFITTSNVGEEGFMSWQMIREIAQMPGMEIGSHGCLHEPLADIPEERALASIIESKAILENKLAKEVRGFTYPSGSFTEKLMKYVEKSGYDYACVATHVHERRFLGDRYAIRRIKISQTSTSDLMFAVRASGFYNLFRTP